VLQVAITDLPQLVAAFHSFVGLAAVLTSAASFLVEPHGGIIHEVSVYLGTVIGGIIFTGSIVAFEKLQGIMNSKPLNLPSKNHLNIGIAAANLANFCCFSRCSFFCFSRILFFHKN